MSIDPDELKVRIIKQEAQIQIIQNYRDEQDALDKENAVGKIGHHEVRLGGSIDADKVSGIFKGKPSI